MERFTTDRLQVAKWREQNYEEDVWHEVLVGLLTDNVTKELPPGWQGLDTEGAKKWSEEREEEGVMLAARETKSNKIVGLLFLYSDLGASTPTAHVGYLVGEPFQGKGFAKELLNGLVSNIEKPTTLRAGVSRHNKASIAVLEKCGLTRCPSEGQEDEQLFYEAKL
eukprot:TRINITY_DN1850_c1_g2_i1.p1 TRINITY_DN1850_c1_g2~~TRINITY_DN1850_c1_g2_i1.p1  ORF type:complete len:166 (+),score=36.79 TRINITY_DN1850_c1_g2_i1:125-622(+)